MEKATSLETVLANSIKKIMKPFLKKIKRMLNRAHPIGVFLVVAELYHLEFLSFEWAIIFLLGVILTSIIFFVDVQIMQTFVEIRNPEEENLDSED
tara:strand:+ start:175 stop:462 length:288 start_codon:yes stop_codon:yes gene_type:complete